MQYFCGMRCFERRFPFDPGGFARFRKRIGEKGFGKIFECGVKVHGEGTGDAKAETKRHISDTTVQENNTAFPTDAKPCKKIPDGCNRIAAAERIQLRRSYRRESKQLMRDSYNGKHPRRMKRAKKARKRLKTIVNAQMRDLHRKMTPQQETTYRDKLELYRRAANRRHTTRTKYTACTNRLRDA